MRGTQTRQGAFLSHDSWEDRVPPHHPLWAIQKEADRVLKSLSGRFASMYSDTGRPSIPSEQLLRTLLLQALYSIRSERMLMEQLEYNLLVRWFVELEIDDRVGVPTVFMSRATVNPLQAVTPTIGWAGIGQFAQLRVVTALPFTRGSLWHRLPPSKVR